MNPMSIIIPIIYDSVFFSLKILPATQYPPNPNITLIKAPRYLIPSKEP